MMDEILSFAEANLSNHIAEVLKKVLTRVFLLLDLEKKQDEIFFKFCKDEEDPCLTFYLKVGDYKSTYLLFEDECFLLANDQTMVESPLEDLEVTLADFFARAFFRLSLERAEKNIEEGKVKPYAEVMVEFQKRRESSKFSP